jgi:hypothetical protein
MNALFSVYFTGTDYAGHQLMYGGDAGVDNDMATLIIAVNEPTEIPSASLSLNTVNEQLMAGQMHTLSMNIDDANGVNSVDLVTVKLLGADEDEVGVMNWEPRNGAMYADELSQLTLHDVRVTDEGAYSLVEWDFTLDWNFDESLITEYALPGIVVFDDDDLNPVVLMTNLGSIRWQLDNNLQVVVDGMDDNTPPISASSSNHIYVQPGDDLTFSGTVVFEKSGAQLSTLPGQGLEIAVSTIYGSETIQSYAEVDENGTWEAGLILPSRSLVENILVVDYYITGVPSPGEDSSEVQTSITVDETSPVVRFSSVPLSLDDSDLEILQFAIQITEDGGMPEGDLSVNWAFLRNNLIMNNGQSSSPLPYISNNSGSWSYVGSIDFTEGVNVSLEDGDELIWWIDVVDRAGNTATGTGMSLIDAMNTDFTVLSFDVTVTNIEISLADGKAPRGNEVVEGTELGIIVHVRNLGTKTGTVTVSLMEDMGESRSWLSHGDQELSLAPGQSLHTIPMLYETHGAGQQNLYVNVTGMDSWVENSVLPHCFAVLNNATCSLNVESDMPRVISQDDAESGLDGLSAFNIILVLLLIGAAFAIVVLMRRDNSDESIFYDDDEWEDDEVDPYSAKVTPVLPPMAPEKPDIDAASRALSSFEAPQAETEVETDISNESTITEDPWADVDHSAAVVEQEVEPVDEPKLEEVVDELVVEEVADEMLKSKPELEEPVKKKRKPVRRKSKSRDESSQTSNDDSNEAVSEELSEEKSDDDVTSVDFSSMTIAQLKDELRSRGLPVKGKKADLIARLEE